MAQWRTTPQETVYLYYGNTTIDQAVHQYHQHEKPLYTPMTYIMSYIGHCAYAAVSGLSYEAHKRVLWQTMKPQMKYNIMLHFIRV